VLAFELWNEDRLLLQEIRIQRAFYFREHNVWARYYPEEAENVNAGRKVQQWADEKCGSWLSFSLIILLGQMFNGGAAPFLA
jgi:hypothetical protein